ncbi:MAG: lipocalin family protein [Bacteroidetes bacterium]|nr:lipocalin family protein [Bacteroidota bacterium]
MSGFDGGVCSKAKPFTIKFFPDQTFNGTAVYGSVGRSLTFFFGKTGQFTDQRLGSVSGSGNTTGAAASTSEKKGTYTISGNTIIIKYTDGEEWRVVGQPYILGNGEILLNDQLFRKK